MSVGIFNSKIHNALSITWPLGGGYKIAMYFESQTPFLVTVQLLSG